VTDELERHAAACIFASFPGAEAPDWVRAWLGRGLGGIVLFADNVADVGRLTRSLRAERPDVVVAIDEEGGDVTRLEAAEGSSYPGNLALGVVDDTELTEAVAASIAAELALAGIFLNLGPVADVNSNPVNPIVGVRSFGSDAALVARHVAAFVRGTQRIGVAACAKHFPGHGDTSVDSHLALPTVEGDLDAALLPFRAAIEAGVDSVMAGHLVVPSFGDQPATLNPRIVTGLLREELRFDGLVVSDALEMRAISATIGIEEGAVQALEAGVDALCIGRIQGEAVVESVHRAILDSVPADRIAEAAARVSSAAQPVSAAGQPERSLGLAAARRALRVEGDVVVGVPPVVVELRPEPSIAAGAAGHGLGDAVRRRLPGTDVIVLTEDAELPSPPQGRPLVLVLRDAARHPWQQRSAVALLEREPIVVETGVPGWLPDGVQAWIATHGAARVNLEAAADAIYGSDTYTKPMHISSDESSPQ
jgi:beta-N-acetylhexosaminidase